MCCVVKDVRLAVSGLGVLIFFVPGHLNGFKGFFVRLLRVVLEFGEGDDPRMHVGEADGEGIGGRVGLHQTDGEFFSVTPLQIVWLRLPLKRRDARHRLTIFRSW